MTMQQQQKISIIGAGGGALGYAYDMRQHGYLPQIYHHPDHQGTYEAARARGYIGVKEGERRDRFQISFTADAKEAHAYSKTLGWSVRGDVRKPFYDQFASLDFSQHTGLFFPGYREELNLPEEFRFAAIFQVSSTPISTLRDEDGINIVGRKGALPICGSLGADREIAKALLPGVSLRWVHNETELCLQTFPALFHVIITNGNSERIKRQEDWLFYKDGLTPEVIETILAVWSEVCGGSKELRFQVHELIFLVNEMYPYGFKSLEDFRDRSPVHANVKAPKDFTSRWLVENTKVDFVFWYDLLVTVKRPVTRLEQEIREAGRLAGRDFLSEGSELRALGHTKLSHADFVAKFGRREL